MSRNQVEQGIGAPTANGRLRVRGDQKDQSGCMASGCQALESLDRSSWNRNSRRFSAIVRWRTGRLNNVLGSCQNDGYHGHHIIIITIIITASMNINL